MNSLTENGKIYENPSSCSRNIFGIYGYDGYIEVPDNIPGEDVEDYITEHFGEVKFSESDLDYAGTDFKFEKE